MKMICLLKGILNQLPGLLDCHRLSVGEGVISSPISEAPYAGYGF